MSKYDDCHRVDNRYTTAIGMSVWRFFNIGKYKNQKVKDVCYFNPFYVAWCLESWQGFSLTSYPSKGANYEHRLARYRAYTKAFNHVREEGIPLAPIQVDKFTKVLVNGVTLCLIGTFEGKSENDFIKEISGKVYVKAGTDSVDVINLQTRRTKRYKVQYT